MTSTTKRYLIVGAVFAVLAAAGIALYSCEGNRCSPHSIAQAVECLKRDGTLGPNVRPLRAPESGSLLGHILMNGDIDRSATCYSGTPTENGISYKELTIHYKSARSLKQDLGMRGAGLHLGANDNIDVDLVLKDMKVAKTTGVFDPLSPCQPGTHDVVDYQLTAAEIRLQGTSEVVRQLSAEIDAGIAEHGSDVATKDTTAFKVIAENVVFAYQTSKLVTEESQAPATVWHDDVQPNTLVNLPAPSGSGTLGLSLKVVSLDRREIKGFKFLLSGRATSASCSVPPDRASELSLVMGVGDSCVVTLSGASTLLLQTSTGPGEIRVLTTLLHTKKAASR